ncbi:MAG: hypothetical protein HOO96_45105, partial [Polyangiaceae bacterium]|nr:hypothetical protein [Polyangiaceae bacterium]
MRSARMLLLLIGATALVACDTFSSEAVGGAAGADASLDADAGPGPVEGGGPVDAQRADAGANLLQNGDFALGCGVWLAQRASVTETDGMNGRGCLVCGDRDATVWGISQVVRALPDAKYVAHAWFAAPVTAAQATAKAVEVELEETSGGKQLNVSTTVAPDLAGS